MMRLEWLLLISIGNLDNNLCYSGPSCIAQYASRVYNLLAVAALNST